MTFKERVAKAVEEDNTITVSADTKMADIKWRSTQYMEFLGLRKSDLKKLVRQGKAANVLLKFQVPSKLFPKKPRGKHGNESRVIPKLGWILVA